jgi:cellulose synthase/poly-beta-1,6-N-acetylglucosamine synthase-like glycosyltransferase
MKERRQPRVVSGARAVWTGAVRVVTLPIFLCTTAMAIFFCGLVYLGAASAFTREAKSREKAGGREPDDLGEGRSTVQAFEAPVSTQVVEPALPSLTPLAAEVKEITDDHVKSPPQRFGFLPWRRTKTTMNIPIGVVAAIIPAHNEELVIAATLESVLVAYHREDIFVFCDNCSDGTAEIARQFVPDSNVLISSGQMGKSRGIEQVLKSHVIPGGYHYVTVIDADTAIEPLFLVNTLRVLRRKDVAGVVGKVKSRWYGTNLISVYRSFLYSLWQTLYKRLQSSSNCILIASGCATTWKTRVLKECDFDARLSAEDFSLTLQVHRKRLGKVKYVSSAGVWTQDPFSVNSYRTQMYRWNRAWWEGVRKYRLGVSWFRFKHGIPVGISMLDISAALVLFDTFMFVTSLLLLPVLLIHPISSHFLILQTTTRESIITAMFWQFGTIIVLASVVGFITRRWKMVFYSPLFIFLLYVDIAMSVKAGFSTCRRLYMAPKGQRGALASVWISPERRKEI